VVPSWHTGLGKVILAVIRRQRVFSRRRQGRPGSFRRTIAISEHKTTIDWKRETPSFAYETYNRDHDWSFDSGVTVRASANPVYLGSESCVDPEEAFVAALSSCHMLTFLAIAARKKLVVDSYHDEAVGVLEKDAGGRLAITRVALRPAVRFGGGEVPGAEELRRLHDQAHHACFIANSVKAEVVVEPQ
jgi:organic hydroperoxide reductase OsmC/OhrA